MRILASLLVCLLSSVSMAEDARERFIKVCVERKPDSGQQRCECFYDAGKAELNDLELDYMIASYERNDDAKVKLLENPKFQFDQYKSKSKAVIHATTQCIIALEKK